MWVCRAGPRIGAVRARWAPGELRCTIAHSCSGALLDARPTLLLSASLCSAAAPASRRPATPTASAACTGRRRHLGRPPDKVAARQGAAQSNADAQKHADDAYLQAPRRPASEPVRVVLVGPATEAPDLAPLAATYRQMLEQALQGTRGCSSVPVQSGEAARRGPLRGRVDLDVRVRQPQSAVDQPLTRRLRDGSGEVDLVVVAHLSTKKVSGFVGNKGGVGMAEVNNVVFELSLSSVYRFEELRHAEVGKSTDSLALAGIDKKGKTGSGQLKGKPTPSPTGPRCSPRRPG